MKRLIIGIVISLLAMGLYVGIPMARADASQIGCYFPQNYKVRCYDYKPYPVHMNVRVRLENGAIRWYSINLPSGWTWSRSFNIYPTRVSWTWYQIGG